MTNLTEQLNRLYLNASAALEKPSSWQFHLYSNPLGSELSRMIGGLKKRDFDWQGTTFSDLSISLNVIKLYARCLLAGDPMNDFWNAELARFEAEIAATRNYLPAPMLVELEYLLGFARENIAVISGLHSEKMLSATHEVAGRVLLIPETARLRHKAEEWVASHGLSEKVSVHSLKDVRLQLFEQFELALFPSAPSAYLNREQFSTHLRALLLAGVAPKATFVAPDWFTFQRDFQLEKQLLPGFVLNGIPPLEVSQEFAESIERAEETPDVSEIYDDWTPRHGAGDYANYEVGGDRPCRLIYIGEDLAFPVEDDSKKVSVFEFNEKVEQWQIIFSDPFKNLKVGDYLVACVDASETQALRDRAAKYLGPEYRRYLTSQQHWKQLLSDRISEQSVLVVEGELRAAGVKKFSRVRYWIEENFIDPLLNQDFEVLLHWLGLGNAEAKLTIELAKAMDGALIQAGRNAGYAIAQSLDDQELARLDKGVAVEITLEDHGDATYLLAPVLSIGEETFMFRNSQVRRVVAGRFEVE